MSYSAGNSVIARRYAKALSELAHDSPHYDKIVADAAALYDLIVKDDKLTDLLKSQAVNQEDQLSLIMALISKINGDVIIANFARTVIVNGRFNLIDRMLATFGKQAKADAGEVEVIVTSAHELSAAANDSLASAIKKCGFSKVDFRYIVDTSVIAGVIVQIGSTMFDASLRTKLNDLEYTMKEV